MSRRICAPSASKASVSRAFEYKSARAVAIEDMTGQADDDFGALDGVRVLDLTRILAGPLCGMMLGDMGADVIKIEPPNGDDTRTWGPPFIEGEATYFLGLNRNKRSLVLNMGVKQGQQILADLARKSDVLLDN